MFFRDAQTQKWFTDSIKKKVSLYHLIPAVLIEKLLILSQNIKLF